VLQVGEVIKGPFWAETVEIKKCEIIDESLYLVEAIGRETNQFYEAYLEEDQIKQLEHLQKQSRDTFEIERLQHYLQYYILKTEEKFSSSRARGNKKIIPLPHQIEAVYSNMLHSPQVRFLLADDPGAGKTIMSGMLIRELLARGTVNRILILVPPMVLRQWQEELYEKFDEEFVIVNRALLSNIGDMNPFETHDKLLASIYWGAREDIKNLILKSNFDLVIVDEAHKMAAYTHGVKKKKIKRTKLYQLGETLLRHTEHCLLLTATPHKGDRENFKHLMSLIDRDIFSKLNSGDSLYEKTNPFIIRRLKESMVNFDGTPLFPKRTTKTIGFDLNTKEKELYEEVTEYVREHFNRAKQNNKPNIAFAMMILQRRLSSSIEAIYLSLVRRKEKLEDLLYNQQKLNEINLDELDEMSAEEQELMEEMLEGEADTLDIAELQMEISVLNRLIRQANVIRQADTERKYLELERTLFAPDGLLAKGEKILIFTESKDTLLYLERRLLSHVPQLAKIVGNFSMDQRRLEVEKFRNDVQIMLATDAGGESINLQFCNQMINYDIPWNPNRLEQRMGRIHRIGQKNEVFVFNLVATNTREGNVLARLLQKLDEMRQDLGHELVYDFIGEILEEQSVDLASLMEQAISGRENLDDIIERMDKTISEEHKRLLEMATKERMDEASFDLPGMRRAYQQLSINNLPTRSYGEFVVRQLQSTRTRLHVSQDKGTVRIERFPKMIREFIKKNKFSLNTNESIRFALSPSKEEENLPLLQNDHALFKTALKLAEREIQQVVMPSTLIKGKVGEKLVIELNQISIVDGTGRVLEQKLLLIGKRNNGQLINIDPLLLFKDDIVIVEMNIEEDKSLKTAVIQEAKKILKGVQVKRDDYVRRKSIYLRRSFEEQMNTLQQRLQQYQSENIDNRNTILINQTFTQIEDLDERSRERLDEIERERSIQLRPVKKIVQLQIEPIIPELGRYIPTDILDIIKKYEASKGRINVVPQKSYGLVDFLSESIDGEVRLILTTDNIYNLLINLDREDYNEIKDKVYVYVVENGAVLNEECLEKLFYLS